MDALRKHVETEEGHRILRLEITNIKARLKNLERMNAEPTTFDYYVNRLSEIERAIRASIAKDIHGQRVLVLFD